MIEKGKSYYRKPTLVKLSPSKDLNGEPVWVSFGPTGDSDTVIFSLIEMNALLKDNSIVDEEARHEVLYEASKNAGIQISTNYLDVLGTPAYMETVIGERFYFYLDGINLEKCEFVASSLLYKPYDADYETSEGCTIDFTLCISLRPQTLEEQEKWAEKTGYSFDREDTLTSEFIKNVKNLPLSRRRVIKKEKPIKKIAEVPKEYSPSFTNSSIPIDSLVDKLKIALGKDDKPKSISILLHGRPGVGKTLAAKYVANKLGKQILSHNIGELLGRYVGESEKAVHKAFKEASNDNSVLLIDEFDSLSQFRDDTSKGYQRQLVNSLLQSLDDFEGVAFFTTNDVKCIDAAVRRRIALDIEFNNLTSEQATTMANKTFKNRRFKDLDWRRLCSSRLR